MSDSVAIIPRRFGQLPFVLSLPLVLMQLALWPLSTLQLMRGYAWFSTMNPLLWLILVCVYGGIASLAVIGCFAWIVKLKRGASDQRIEAHVHPNLAAFVYAIMSVLTSAPAIMILSYYYAHFGGEAPVAKHAGDINAALERRDIWLGGHVMLNVSCLLGVFQFLSQVLTPSVAAIRFIMIKTPIVGAEGSTNTSKMS